MTVLALAAALPFAAARAVHAAAPVGIEALARRTASVARVADPVPAPAPTTILACGSGQAQGCFDSLGVPQEFVNVGSFFDRGRRTSSNHFFVKLFTPPDSTVQVHLVGFNFIANRSGFDFPGAGIVTTSLKDPVFPSTEQLSQLQLQAVRTLGGGATTCVDVPMDVKRGQVAWLVLGFPDAADSVFVGVRAEADANDHPCDFMTPNHGDYWYRPDPNQSHYDWEIRAYYEATTNKPPVAILWNAAKRLYR